MGFPAKRWYVNSAVVLLTTILLFLSANAVSYLGIRLYHLRDMALGPLAPYGKDRVMRAYPGWREEDVLTLTRETWGDRPGVYEPFTQFREAPFRGRFVNVHEAGFRAGHGRETWPPSAATFNVFIFGGSTAFGYGVADNETIPSKLRENLANTCSKPVEVYNFGQGGYFSTQELLLLYSLLTKGFAPDMAVFIDGLNDFCFLNGEPYFTDQLRNMFPGGHSSNNAWKILFLASELPMYRVAAKVRNMFTPSGTEGQAYLNESPDDRLLSGVVSRWLTNKQLIEALCAKFRVQSVFVWQPTPLYKYDLSEHLLYGTPAMDVREDRGTRNGYPLMRQKREELDRGGNFLWLADIQEGRRANFYVDQYHYTAAFSNEIASRIHRFLQDRGLLACKVLQRP